MRAEPERRTVAYVACPALAIVCCACGSAAADHADGAAQHGAVTVGSFDFPESVLLADIYAGALTAQGLPVRVLPDLGPRELVDPALMSGLVQVVPRLRPVGARRLSAWGGLVPRRPVLRRPFRALAGWRGCSGAGTAGRPLAAQDRRPQRDTGVALLFSTDPAITADPPGGAGRRPRPAAGRERRPAGTPGSRRPLRPAAPHGPRHRIGAPDDRLAARPERAGGTTRGDDPRLVAGSWLRAQGLASEGEVSR